MIELLGSYPRSQLDLLRVGEALSGQGLASEQSPPRFLEVEPARPHWDEDLLHSQMLLQPSPDRWALVAGEVVGYEVQITARIALLDGFEQPQVAFGIARGSGERERLTIAYPQSTVDPDPFGSSSVFQGHLNAVAVRRPAGSRWVGPRAHRPQLV